ncbi:hypothetical protein [Metallosphaera javensis (ex Sakai et al. 2022)]|uniref:hypothetical protein n=1 Tax=Metallosphaera javensis (ex Sakai et al. 2022) TaxID=2775498 RepID=UPI0025868D4A|nr:MAG: hypothetical protein MjAS7_1992 [Metallosphaera javensis (ex Sakai et al. 2022)]
MKSAHFGGFDQSLRDPPLDWGDLEWWVGFERGLPPPFLIQLPVPSFVGPRT